MKLSIYISLFLYLPAACFAQVAITGRIISQTDTRPVANASVFLNSATIGAKTAEDGTFILNNVKPGKYQLIVSIIGFDSYNKLITVNQDKLALGDITILPKAIALKEVKIKPKDETGRDFNLTLFKQYFLGTSALAEDCVVLNPQVLDMDYDVGAKILTASTTDFLEIKNDALGYKIKYQLKSFTLNQTANEIQYEGSVFFEALSGSASQEKKWAKNRQEVYDNSSMHFLRAVIAGDVAAEGFQVQVVTDNGQQSEQKLITSPLAREDYFKPGAQKGAYNLFCTNGSLFISFSKDRRFSLKTALVRINDPTNKTSTLVSFNSAKSLFDSNGTLLNPASVVFSGAWGNNRLAELLPSDYEPPAGAVAVIDSSLFKNVAEKLDAFDGSQPVEKVYLHLDKQAYFPGDTVWYKAYAVTGQHQLSLLSKILYVELVAPNDSLVKCETISLFSGTGSGDFTLPARPGPGSYRIRAYTNWMRNGDPADIYDRRLLITGQPAIAIKQQLTPPPDIQFFPEGGELINGLRSRVAVKAVNTSGFGENISGTIVDNDGQTVTEFKTQHLGMGVFAFTPQTGKTYAAKIQVAGKPDLTVDLPKAQDLGYSLTVNNSQKDSIYIKVAAGEALLKARPNSPFYLVAQSAGKIYYTSAGKCGSVASSFSVEKSRFPSGIVQFTLFSERMEPLNERIAFIQQDDTLKLKLDSIGQNAATREDMKPQLIAADNANAPVIGSFSVAVTNESLVGTIEPEESTIFNNLLLTSELKGYIEKPNYYFINQDDQTRADLDVLMLTQGYRRYEWKRILDPNEKENAYEPEKSLSITGVVQTASGKPVAGRKIMMAVTRMGLFASSETDKNGIFEFDRLGLANGTKILFNAGDDGFVKIIRNQYLAATPMAPPSPSPEIKQLLSATYESYLQILKNDSLNKVHVLKEITVRDRKMRKEPDLTGSANLNGPGHADQVITADQLNNCINLADCLNGKLHGVYEEGGLFFVQRSQNYMNLSGDMTPKLPYMVIIVDGAIMDSQYIADLNAKDVQSVEVLVSASYLSVYGSNAPFGALVITTKRGIQADTSNTASALSKYTFSGFYPGRVFYSPKYYHQQTTTTAKDFRSTVYWNPYLITGKEGRAAFDYFNADAKGTYRVVIEGVDINGHLGRMVYRYSVE